MSQSKRIGEDIPQPLISVVICTYNRADLLEQVLKTLVIQTLPAELFEILIIDNNSHDQTADLSSKIIADYPDLNIRYFLEEKQGLSHARNRGWMEAHGEYVAYVDDDCKVPSEWLSVANRIIGEVHPTIFGGPYYAFYMTEKPVWFKDEYGSHVQGNVARPLQSNEYISGGNIVFLKKILEKYKGFNPHFGMSGETIAYGEETILIKEIREREPDSIIYYDPSLYVFHLVRPEKMKVRWMFQSSFFSGVYSYHTFKSNKFSQKFVIKKAIHLIILFWMIIFDLTVCIVFRNRQRFPYFQNYLYEHTIRYISGIGNCLAFLKELVLLNKG